MKTCTVLTGKLWDIAEPKKLTWLNTVPIRVNFVTMTYLLILEVATVADLRSVDVAVVASLGLKKEVGEASWILRYESRFEFRCLWLKRFRNICIWAKIFRGMKL